MNETYDLFVLWGARKEPPEACARRALKLLGELIGIDPCFTTFQSPAQVKRKHVNKALELNLDELTTLFARGVNRTGLTRKIIEELGFNFSVSTPGRHHFSLQLHGGAYSPWTYNSCELDLPSQGPDSERFLTVTSLTELMRCMVDAWEPNHGLATSYGHWTLVNEDPKELPVGWLMYFSRAWGTVPPLPAPVRIEPLSDKGMLVILTPERLTASNPEHVELGRRVRDLLRKAGLLERRMPW